VRNSQRRFKGKRLTGYRYPSEGWILALTLVIVFGALIFTAGATICLAPLLVAVFVGISYSMMKNQHNTLVKMAVPVNQQKSPALTYMLNDIQQRLQAGPVQAFIVPTDECNAYTYGLTKPYDLVLYSSLFKIMNENEVRFVVGHEVGHSALGHTWLNSLMGGMAGLPTSLGAMVVLVFAFRWWNRACEYSADRAGLLACGSLDSAVSALVALATGRPQNSATMQRALAAIEAQDDDLANELAETLSTHPMIARRIHELRQWAATSEYRAWQTRCGLPRRIPQGVV
jgi:Zn-dependent protease with chaperone function